MTAYRLIQPIYSDMPERSRDSNGNSEVKEQRSGAREGTASDEQQPQKEADVLLDVPQLSVDRVRLNVDDLEARLALNVQLADLLQVQAGVHLNLATVDVEIEGVDAEAYLRVRLDELRKILDIAFNAITENPDLFEDLLSGVGDAARGATEAAGNVAKGAGEAAEGAGEAAGETADSGGITSRLARARRAVTGTLGDVGDSASDAAESISDRAGDMAENVREKAGDAAETLRDAVEGEDGEEPSAEHAEDQGPGSENAGEHPIQEAARLAREAVERVSAGGEKDAENPLEEAARLAQQAVEKAQKAVRDARKGMKNN